MAAAAAARAQNGTETDHLPRLIILPYVGGGARGRRASAPVAFGAAPAVDLEALDQRHHVGARCAGTRRACVHHRSEPLARVSRLSRSFERYANSGRADIKARASSACNRRGWRSRSASEPIFSLLSRNFTCLGKKAGQRAGGFRAWRGANRQSFFL